MKKSVFLSSLLVLVCALAGCNKSTDPEGSFYIAGTWLGSHVPDDAQRVVVFEGNKTTARYITSYFNPDYLKEELDIPFTFDAEGGDLVMDFTRTYNIAGISEIVLRSNKEEDMMAGLIRYAEESHDPDTLFLSRPDEPFELEENSGAGSYLSGIDMGPRNPSEEMKGLDWVNPFTPDLEGAGTDNIATETVLLWASKQIGAAAVSTLATKLFNALWSEILPINDPVAVNVKKIVQDLEIIEKQLVEINKKLDELIKFERLREVTTNLTARNDRYIKLNSAVSEILLTIENEIKGSDPEVANRNIQKAILEWGKSVCDGNMLYNAVENYVNTSLMAFGYKAYPRLYDDFAYETNAWECDGYEWREMLRATDESLVTVTSALTVMYYTAKCQINEISETTLLQQVKKQESLLLKMNDKYTAEAVKRNPDKMICQIYDFHKVFNRDVEWRNLQYPTWYPSKSNFYLNPDYLVFGKNGGPCMDRFLTEGEYKTLMKYYSNKTGSILSILKELGFNVKTDNPDARNAKMLLPNGAHFTFKLTKDQNNDIYVNKVVNNYYKTDESNVYVGEVYAPGHFTWSKPYWIKVFSKYVKYDNNTWFNLQVQQRMK